TAATRAAGPSSIPPASTTETRRRPSQVPTTTARSVVPSPILVAGSLSGPPSRPSGAAHRPDTIAPTPIVSVGVPPSSRPPSPRRAPSGSPPSLSEAIYAPSPRESQSSLRSPTGDRPPPSSRSPSSSAQHALGTGTRPSMENAAAAAVEAQAILVHTVAQSAP